MKAVRISFLVFCLNISSSILAQVYIDTLVHYGLGKSCSVRITDSTARTNIEIDFYPDGSPQIIERFLLNTKQYIDSSIAFHENGKIAWIRYFNNASHLLEGPFFEYYPNGNIKTSGFYFNGFKSGVWKKYYEYGTVKNEIKFELSKEDSVFNFNVNNISKSRVSYDTLVWGGPFKFIDEVHNDTLTIEPLICYFSYFLPTTIIYSRQYDYRGKPVIPSRKRKPRKNAP